MEMRFMLDIETTGLDFVKDDIIEIGIMAITREPRGLWEYYKHTNLILASSQQPKPDDKFAQEHMKALYVMANDVYKAQNRYDDPMAINFWAKSFFDLCLRECELPAPGAVAKGGDVVLCGWNVATFDIPFMQSKGFLTPKDYSYRVHEQSGGVYLSMGVLDLDRVTLLEAVKKYQTLPGGEAVDLTGMTKHRALWDCVDQAKTENALIRMLRASRVDVQPTELEPT